MTESNDVDLERDGGPSPELLAATLHAELLQRKAMLATAESLTGGQLGDMLSAGPGASETYLGGVVSYATEIKQKVLRVSEQTVAEHGVVSAECAEEMAAGVKELLGSDYAVSTTGVAGPATQEGKPVGRVFVGLAGPWGTKAVQLDLDGERAEIRERACREAVNALTAAIKNHDG